MRKKIVIGIVGIAGLLVAAGVTPAMADDTATSTVSGGTLSFVTSGVSLSAVTLNGGASAQSATGTASSGWSITDPRGTGAQWALSVTATAPTSAGGSIEQTARVIPVGNLTITPGTISAGADSDATTNITAAALAMTGASQVLVSSSGSNKGTYTFTPSFSLKIPANAFRSNYAGAVGASALNAYTSTLTYTIG